MEQYFSSLFEDIRHESSSLLLLSKKEPDIFRQSKFLDHEVEIIKIIALEKHHRQRNLKKILLQNYYKNNFLINQYRIIIHE